MTNEKTTKKRILLVEDNRSYLDAALKFFANREPELDIVTASDFKSAESAIKTQHLDGIITDCFFPKEIDSTDISLGLAVIEKIAKYLAAVSVEDWKIDHFLQPMKNALESSASDQALGVLVVELALKVHLPCIISTSTYHHDNITQPIYDYMGYFYKVYHEIVCIADVDSEYSKPSKSEFVFWENLRNEYEFIPRVLGEGIFTKPEGKFKAT